MESCRQCTLGRQETQRKRRVQGPHTDHPSLVPLSPIVSTVPEFQQTMNSSSWNRHESHELPPTGSPSQEARSNKSNKDAATEGACSKLRLEALQVSLLQSKRVYRRRLRSRLICTFCLLLVVGAVACVATAAVLTRHASPRGALLAMEGVLELLPENPNYCARGTQHAVTAFRAEVFNAVEDRMDAVFGNVSAATSYSGSLVENIACLVRRGGVRVQVDFLVFWRSHRNRYSTLSDVPGPKVLVGALQDSLDRSNGSISKFRVATGTLTIAESRRIA
ncbi:hypothetical protein ISCGN_001675 [Ixodes scapularis]